MPVTIPVLVVDANLEFSILIRQTLEETGGFQVTLASSGAEAVEIVQSSDIRLAIVDFGLPDHPGPEAVRKLRSADPELAIIAIPLSGGANDPELEEIEVDGLLSKPFYLPDLPEIIARALQMPASALAEPSRRRPAAFEAESEAAGPAATAEPPPPWLEDVDQAAMYLTRLNLETAAEAALLTRGRRVWTYAGQLDQHHIQDLTGLIADHWAREGARGAVAKFVRLPGVPEDYMLYATALRGDIILSLVFSAETPFGLIRRQGQTLAHALSEVDPSHLPPEAAASEPDEAAQPSREMEATVPLPRDWIPEEPFEPEETPFLRELAEMDLPSPDPETSGTTSQEPGKLISPEVVSDAVAIPADWVPSEPRPASHLPFLEHIDPAGIEEEAQPEPEMALPEAPYYLTYTAILLPRFPEHHLAGPLAADLASWVKRICLAWDWRAEGVEIQPEYLNVTLSLQPEVAPARAVRKLRENLSTRILEMFPKLSKDLPSGRFWAQSYLLTAGNPPDFKRVQAFIQDTRRSQGISCLEPES